MKRKIYIAAILTLSLLAAACGSSGGDSNKGAASPIGTTDNASARDVTDYGQCNNGPTANRITGTWGQSFDQGELRFDLTMRIAYDSVTVTNECYLKGRSLRASTSSPSSFTDSRFTVSSSNSNHQEINEPGFNFKCDVSIKPMSVNYSFKGSCLVMSKDGQNIVLLPR